MKLNVDFEVIPKTYFIWQIIVSNMLLAFDLLQSYLTQNGSQGLQASEIAADRGFKKGDDLRFELELDDRRGQRLAPRANFTVTSDNAIFATGMKCFLQPKDDVPTAAALIHLSDAAYPVRSWSGAEASTAVE